MNRNAATKLLLGSGNLKDYGGFNHCHCMAKTFHVCDTITANFEVFFQAQVPNVDHEDGFRQAPRDESILHQHAGMEMVRAGIHPQISDPGGASR